MLSFKQYIIETSDLHSADAEFHPHVLNLRSLIIHHKEHGMKWLRYLEKIRERHGQKYSTEVLNKARNLIPHNEEFDKLLEDGAMAVPGPTNAAGNGAVAGIGQPPGSKSGEPGVNPKKKRNVVLSPTYKRNPPRM